MSPLRNLLASKGYGDLDAVRADGRREGREEGREEALREALRVTFAARGWALTDAHAQRIAAGRDPAVLSAWIARAVSAGAPDEVFTER